MASHRGKKLVLKHVNILHRHGDRTPTFNCMQPNVLEAASEASAWAELLPVQKTLDRLARQFPVITSHKVARDVKLGIFGSLTKTGLDQMHTLGKALRGKYMSQHQLLTQESQIQVYASNYNRTQLSAQGLLVGLFTDESNNSTLPTVSIHVPNEGDDYLNVWGKNRELQQLLSDTMTSEDILEFEESDKVMDTKNQIIRFLPIFDYKIRPFVWIGVVDYFHCRRSFSNPYRHHYEHIYESNSADENDITTNEASKLVYTQKRIEEIFRMYDKNNDGALSIDEIAAALRCLGITRATQADAKYFHQAITQHKDDDIIDFHTFCAYIAQCKTNVVHLMDQHNWEKLERVSESVLSSRFDYWFRQPKILSFAIGGLWHKMLLSINDTIDFHNGTSSKQPNALTIFSAHDVTILPLLFALKLWQSPYKSLNIATDDSVLFQWPGYGCTINLELYQDVSAENEWYIRILHWHGFNIDNSDNIEFNVTTLPDEEEFIPLSRFTSYLDSLTSYHS